ncbi:MAG: hypothetical protein VYA34_16135, partial [Myxococcota bacterium]|nr:hypothetical protein [Myxococcota bacterium]
VFFLGLRIHGKSRCIYLPPPQRICDKIEKCICSDQVAIGEGKRIPNCLGAVHCSTPMTAVAEGSNKEVGYRV